MGKVQKKGPAGKKKKDKLERVTGLGRRTREAIAKWNQMTALRFQTGGRHLRHPRPPFGGPETQECCLGTFRTLADTETNVLDIRVMPRYIWSRQGGKYLGHNNNVCQL